MGKIRPSVLLQRSKEKKPEPPSQSLFLYVGFVAVAAVVALGLFFLFRTPGDATQLPLQAARKELVGGKEAQKGAEGAAAGGNALRVLLQTSHGDIYLELYAQDCPKTVENFVTHSKQGFYKGVVFHRIIRGFMIQGGDPTGTGRGGESIWGGSFKDEFQPHLKHEPFTLSMANAGPDSNGSQFFITTAATPHLDGRHTVFGTVVRGKEVVQAIENVPTDSGDRPLTPVTITNVVVDPEMCC